MFKRFQIPFSFLILVAAVFWTFYGSIPRVDLKTDVSEEEFSTGRAFKHVKILAEKPHYIGSSAHGQAKQYILNELEELGLEVETQKTASLNKHGVFTHPENILARIEGSEKGKALLLLSHYDSAVHSSPGASDAASGVATILEGIRAFLTSGVRPVNDIIIVFTDAEEVGLNGAQSFMTSHPWAEEVGLALNFESRGSGGNSFMLLETNGGNQTLIEHFLKAEPEYPVTNSLAYSVYKLLPNDTDLTVLREEGSINGFNFAFIDDHFDYHTATDTPENLDANTLAHQGSYLMPLLRYFSQAPLDNLDAVEDLVYFNVPVLDLITYPFSWILPMLLLAVFLFLGLLAYGIFTGRLDLASIFQGFLPFLISLGVTGLLAYLLWRFCLFIYPEYLEMEQGFTYNGYYYIAAVAFLTLGVCFYTYNKYRDPKSSGEIFVAPLFFWLILCAIVAVFLKGAAFFVVPVFFGLLQFLLLIRQKKPNLILISFLSLPAIFILLPLALSFPVALGLKILFVEAILLMLLWTLLWPIFRSYGKLQFLGFLSVLTFFVLIAIAHFQSEFNESRPKPNSLVYLYNADEQTATWNTYDELEDEWTRPYFEEAYVETDARTGFSSKYNSGFKKVARAEVVPLKEPEITVRKNERDSLVESTFQVQIIPKRNINRIEIFTNELTDFPEFKVNGVTAPDLSNEKNPLHIFKRRWTQRLLTYYAGNRDTLTLEFKVEKGERPQFTIFEASHDLLENEDLQVPPRSEDMMPRPFVLNDAVIIKKTFSLEPYRNSEN